ncbi:MAG TPA: hypothetical protein VFY52_05035 [Thermoleophilaceae bacterium]|nr:hypothetical protein [Thermoleophilaceae bacterium]
MPLNRVVALATPLFAAAAGWVSTWLAENIPGVSIPQSALEEIFIAGALIALAPAAQWLHGWQKWEARQADAQQALEIANAAPPTLVAVEADTAVGFFDESGDFDELDELDALDELDDLDEELLAEEEAPAPAGG